MIVFRFPLLIRKVELLIQQHRATRPRARRSRPPKLCPTAAIAPATATVASGATREEGGRAAVAVLRVNRISIHETVRNPLSSSPSLAILMI